MLNNKHKQSNSITSFLSKIEVFVRGINNTIKNKIADVKLVKEQNKDKFDIGVDDIHAEYKNIPKKLGFATIALGFFIMLVLTVLTVREQVSEVDNERSKVDTNKTKEGEVEISVDEQGWKYYQGKRIDLIASRTKEDLNATREELKKDSLIMQENVRKDLNETVGVVKGYIDGLNTKMEDMKSDISQQLTQQRSEVDAKVQETTENIVKKIQTTIPATSTTPPPALDGKSTLLPPPLGSLSTRAPSTVRKEVAVVYAEPDTEGYDYSDVEVNNIDVAVDDTSTSLYVDTNITAPEAPRLHIMKGLVRATLLTGVNAPTFGGGSDKNPAPVLLSIDGNTLIANNEDEVIENCLVSGSANGNVNTSKADILLTEISCSGHNKKGDRVKIEMPIKGWVIGEDGSFGLSGRLLDSSGNVITKMIALEIIKGVTAAMVASSQPAGAIGTFSTAATGTQVTAATYPEAAQGGLGKGISKGLDHAFEHYNQILSGMYPTISVLAGKKITILLKGGEDVEPGLYRGVDIYEEIEAK